MVLTACAALEPNDSNTRLAPSSTCRIGCGVWVRPCTQVIEIDTSYQTYGMMARR